MSNLASVLPSLLPTLGGMGEVDEPVLEYLCSMLVEEGTLKSEAHIHHVLSDMLISYDIAHDETQAKNICHELYQALVTKGLIVEKKATPAANNTATATTTTSSSSHSTQTNTSANSTYTSPPAGFMWKVCTEKLRGRLQAGCDCIAKSKRDGKFYDCKIESVNESNGTYVVLFAGKDRERQTVDLRDIKVLEKAPWRDEELIKEMAHIKVDAIKDDFLDQFETDSFVVKKLAKPVVIGDFGVLPKEKEAAVVNSALDAVQANGDKKTKETRAEKKERLRQLMEEKREKERQKRDNDLKFEALKRYLQADKLGKSTDVDISGITIATPDGSQELLANAHIKFVTGRRYALVGRNGVGKTTLMRHISNYELPDFPVHLRVVHVEQEVSGDDTSVIDSVLSADVERDMLLIEEKKLLALLNEDEVKKAKEEAKKKELALRAFREEQRAQRMLDNSDDSEFESDLTLDDIMKDMEDLEKELDAVPEQEEKEEKEEDEQELEEEIKQAEEDLEEKEDEEGGEDNASSSSSSSNTANRSKSKRGKINRSQRATGRKVKEIALPDAAPVDPNKRLAEVYARMRDIDVDGAEARARAILQGLQFSRLRQSLKTKELSGGWRMRVALAQALFVQPDILLLDEPTNHLDFPAVMWLEDYLQKYEKTLIVVSHDRNFLDTVATDIIHHHQRTLHYYRGNYSHFERQRGERLKIMQREYAAQQAKRAHIQQFIDKFRYNAKRASLVQSRIKMLAKMDTLMDVAEEKETVFNFPEVDRLEGHIISCNRLKFGYDAKRILIRDCTLNVDMDSRVGVLGANGVGKSTLLNLLMGKLRPLEGEVYRNAHARIAMFAQHHVDGLDLRFSAVDLMMQLFPGNNPQIFRRHLGSFGVTGELATNPIRALSGGQKSRVAFAIVTWKRPHLIIMDEPTNHLDLETIEALIQAVQNFGGGLLFVSHDFSFLQGAANEFWGVSTGLVKRFDNFNQAKTFSYTASEN